MLRLLLCLLLSLWGNIAVVHAQNAKVTMKMDNANVKEVLTQIEKATDYIFLYQSGSINLDRKVSVNVTNEPLSTVLEKIFKDTGVTWSVKNRQISLKQGEIPASQT